MSYDVQANERIREQIRKQAQGRDGFDYGSPAELFPSRSRKGRGRVTYKRFDTAAEALRFAVEEMPEAALLGAYLEVDEVRFGLQEIRDLYDNARYPLKRSAPRN
jgi:hypothetical protein